MGSPAALADLPNELTILVISHLPKDISGAMAICALGGSCSRFQTLCQDDFLWQPQHDVRWGAASPHRAAHVASWLSEYRRRHVQDANAVRCVERLAARKQDSGAWDQLLSYGIEVLDRMCALCRDESWFAGHPMRQTEAEKVAVALNQSVVRREWVDLLARSSAHAQLVAAGRQDADTAEPAIEEGALLLVRLYQPASALARHGPHHAAAQVRAQLHVLASRLSQSLVMAGQRTEGTDEPASAVDAVRALSHLLFTEEGFGGNVRDYYNSRNSLLDEVLASRKGIPISLSVLFAAVCARVGVRLDFIGLPGHFLLATRPDPAAGHERVFVDAFHGGELLDLRQCESIVRSYGIPWSDEMARPTKPAEVWARMLRNLINCHEQVGDYAALRVARAMLEVDGRTRPDEAAAAVPYVEPVRPPIEMPNAENLSRAQQQQLLQMLQLMQVAQQQQQAS